MSSYKSFAIVGFGEMGSLILNEFLKATQPRAYKLRVLTRSKDKPELAAYASRGIDIIPVDYSSPESLTQALKGVDVVLSTLRDDGLDLQKNVVRAAKSAGVRLFVPSEYGRNTLGDMSEYLKVKAETQDLLKELGLPYTLFFIGIFPEMLFTSSFASSMGIDLAEGKFELFGDGNVPSSWTSPLSIAPYVHHVLTTLPESQLENRVFKIEGDRKTFREIIAVWEAKHGKRAKVTVRTEEEMNKFDRERSSTLIRFSAKVWRDGSMLVGDDDNGVWPEWKPLKWEDVMP